MNSVSWLAWKDYTDKLCKSPSEIRVYLYICTWCILHHFEGNTEGHIFLNIQIKMTLHFQLYKCLSVQESLLSCIRTWRTYLIQSQGAPTLCCHQMGTTQKCLFETRGLNLGNKISPERATVQQWPPPSVKCPLSLLKWAVGSHACDPCCSSTFSHPSDLESCSLLFLTPFRVNSDAPVEVEDIRNHCLTFENKTLPWRWRKEEGDVYLLGSVCLWLLSQRGAVHARWGRHACTQIYCLSYICESRFHWKSLFYKCK